MNKIFLLLSASQGLLLSTALLSKVVKADYFRFFLGIIFFTISIEILTYWGLQSDYIITDPLFPFWSLGSYLLLPPAINSVLKHLSQKGYAQSKHDYLMLGPGVAEVLVKISRFYVSRWFQIELYDTQHPIWVFITQVLPILWMIFILAKSFRWGDFSQKYFLIHALFTLILLLWIIDFVFPGEVFIIIETVLIGLLFGFGYIAYNNPGLFDTPKHSRLDLLYEKHDDRANISAYENYIISSQHFTDPGISLKDVAEELSISAKYLSYVINKHYQMNFKNHLNQLRTQKVMEQIEQNKQQNLTLLGIALDAGFNSKSSFNAIFKEQTGFTPTAFLKNMEEKESRNQ